MNSQDRATSTESFPPRLASPECQLPAPQCRAVLVHFPFLGPRNNTAPVAILTDSGGPVPMQQFVASVFYQAALLVRASLVASTGEWTAETAESVMNLLRDGTSGKVQWNLGGGLNAYSELSMREDEGNLEAWVWTVRMLGDSHGMHCVVVEKPEAEPGAFWSWLRTAVGLSP